MISGSLYHPKGDSAVAWVINDLKKYDFTKQNLAIESFAKWGSYNDISKDDLFVLGRNICQSASGDGGFHSFSAHNFIEKFDSFNAPAEVKTHILNGVAYEMYFDRDGSLKERFKTFCCDSIISLLEQPRFIDSKIFIRSKLIDIKRLVYLPGSGY